MIDCQLREMPKWHAPVSNRVRHPSEAPKAILNASDSLSSVARQNIFAGIALRMNTTAPTFDSVT